MLTGFWKFCCSLKLAVCLASLATVMLMAGSLLFPGNPQLFGTLDQMPLSAWLSQVDAGASARTAWFYPLILALLLLLVNTLCCFIDWLSQVRSRWRKSGEYLIHLGFVLMLLGFIWGSVAGWRHIALPCGVGELTPLPHWPGHYIAVDQFEPSFGKRGQPLDMVSQVRLLKGEQELIGGEVRINQPLLFEKLVVTPASFSQNVVGFHFVRDGQIVSLREGSVMTLEDGQQFEVLRFFADARATSSGQVIAGRQSLGSPAMEIRQRLNQKVLWQGWYFLGSSPPAALKSLQLRPVQPLYQSVSHLTINYDPGVRLTAGGAVLMTAGCLIALCSFYRKRRHQDRPEV